MMIDSCNTRMINPAPISITWVLNALQIDEIRAETASFRLQNGFIKVHGIHTCKY